MNDNIFMYIKFNFCHILLIDLPKSYNLDVHLVTVGEPAGKLGACEECDFGDTCQSNWHDEIQNAFLQKVFKIQTRLKKMALN